MRWCSPSAAWVEASTSSIHSMLWRSDCVPGYCDPSASHSETSFDPSSRPISTESSRCASALPRISALGLQIDPNLYSCAWKRFGLIEPDLTPNLLSSRLISGTSPLPLGRSQRTCSATVGLAPVSLLTCAASANFSSNDVAAPACENVPKHVPANLTKPRRRPQPRKDA